MALQEKQKLASVLQRLAPKGAAASATDGVLPVWYPQLLELLTRHLRRPSVVNDELRYAEWGAEAQLAREPATVEQAFGAAFDPLAAKLLSDVCGFLVSVAQVHTGFRTFARGVFAQPDIGAAAALTATATLTVAGSGPSLEGSRSVDEAAGTACGANPRAGSGAETAPTQQAGGSIPDAPDEA